MKYCSTRGGVADLSFVDALLMGLAPDGGLLVPAQLPDVSTRLEQWRELDFVGLAQEVIALFVDDIDRPTLDRLIAESYATFNHPEVIGWQQLDDVAVMELFHGPTLAFKDVALQLLGRLFEHVLGERRQHLNILGATSGDTGGAAIAGVRGQDNIDIFILFPEGKVSPLQELQMTTVTDSNVHCVAVQGSFDDCQSLMKEIFADLDFKARYQLGAVNSVNWARVMAQIVYYGYASLRFETPPAFCVPTGNFGNVFAAFLAKKMGFPIDRLLVATNENDILARFFATGEYARGDVHFTLSPAMDIQVASNFERFLYYYFDKDTARLKDFMQAFSSTGEASLGGGPPDADFMQATAVNTEQTLAAVKHVYEQFNYVLDPHTAVGYAACEVFRQTVHAPLVCVATAHPAKFPDAVHQAAPDALARHPSLDALAGLPSNKQVIPATIEAVKQVISEQAQARSV
ncbi:MAG: threonine synthase [bacterium]